MTTFGLIHSPLVGPFTWAPVAEELGCRKFSAAVPSLVSIAQALNAEPYWKRHAQSAAQTIRQVQSDEPVLLVGHSGAGMLLPAIRQALGRPIAGYIFVDAGIPYDGKSRLDLFDREGAEQFRSSAVDGLLPTWTDADLADVIPDTRIRSRFIAELRPLPIAVYEEPLPVFDRWPDAPCGYVAFLPEEGQYVYRDALSHAEQHSWPCAKIKGMHFHMLVDPAGVADALVEVAGRMGVFQTRGAGV